MVHALNRVELQGTDSSCYRFGMYWACYYDGLKALGVDQVYVVDIMQKRLDKAMELGATDVINGREKNTVEELMKLTDGRGVDLAIDTSGIRNLM